MLIVDKTKAMYIGMKGAKFFVHITHEHTENPMSSTIVLLELIWNGKSGEYKTEDKCQLHFILAIMNYELNPKTQLIII